MEQILEKLWAQQHLFLRHLVVIQCYDEFAPKDIKEKAKDVGGEVRKHQRGNEMLNKGKVFTSSTCAFFKIVLIATL